LPTVIKMEKKKKKQKSLKIEILLPEGVSAQLDKSLLIFTGPMGSINRNFPDKRVSIECKDNRVILNAPKFNMMNKKIIKSCASHIKNMAKGIVSGHKYVLKICSGHFPMNISVSKDLLIVKNFLGEKIPRTLNIKTGATVKVEGDEIIVESPSKETAGQVSADIEQITKRTGYDTRVFQDGCFIINKDGKEIV
jgi:large subunit ribosomal protein L6